MHPVPAEDGVAFSLGNVAVRPLTWVSTIGLPRCAAPRRAGTARCLT